MQLNIYVPKEKSNVLTALEHYAASTRRPKNEIVLEALERYLSTGPMALGKFSLGDLDTPRRAEFMKGGPSS